VVPAVTTPRPGGTSTTRERGFAPEEAPSVATLAIVGHRLDLRVGVDIEPPQLSNPTAMRRRLAARLEPTRSNATAGPS